MKRNRLRRKNQNNLQHNVNAAYAAFGAYGAYGPYIGIDGVNQRIQGLEDRFRGIFNFYYPLSYHDFVFSISIFLFFG